MKYIILALISSTVWARTDSNQQMAAAPLTPARSQLFIELCVESCMQGGRKSLAECREGCGKMSIRPIAEACNQKITDQPNECSKKKMSSIFEQPKRQQNAEGSSSNAVD